MRRFRRGLVLLPVLLALIPATARPSSAAVRQQAIGIHHLPTSPSSPVFSLGIRGGFSAGGSFTLTIYADGHLRLTKPPGGRFRLQNRKLQLYLDALRGLLKLAEAEGFFSLPSQITGANPNPDASKIFITVTTAEGAKSVTVLAAVVPAFDELYDVLTYTAGVTR